MLKSYQYRIYPTEEQKIMLSKHFGCHRWVYNWGLDQKMRVYKETGKSISRFDLQKQLPELKKQEETKWLAEVNAQSLQMSLDHLDKAFVRFFRDKKGYPKFKSKSNRQSFQCFDGIKVDWIKGIKLPKMDYIPVMFSRKFEGIIKTTTVSKTPTSKYFISILVDVNKKESELRNIDSDKSIGIDTGIKQLLTLSNGIVYENNRYLKNSLQRLKVLQRRASKKVKGSNNRKKANRKVALLYEKITNQRKDYLHKITTELTNENQVSTYCIEDLNIVGMMNNHKLAQALTDVSISEFYRQLEYKCKWKGINLIKIGRFEPSSKMCSNCGNIKKDQTLADRMYNCEKCGHKEDRDVNAAKNIKSMALHPQNNTRQGMPNESVEMSSIEESMKQKY